MASKNHKGKGTKVSPTVNDAENPQKVATPGLISKAVSFQVKKVFLDYEEGQNPELEPTFANHFELFALGTDVFLDIGILKPDEMLAIGLAPTEPEHPIELQFFVTHRIAMSHEAFNRLHSKITEAQKLLIKAQKHAAEIQKPK